MKETLKLATEYTVLLVDWMALAIVVYAAVEAFSKVLSFPISAWSLDQKRAVWLHLSRWLIAALTFQLAADIVESATSTSWESIGRLGAIAVIRTFLNYFLEKDVKEISERAAEPVTAGDRLVEH